MTVMNSDLEAWSRSLDARRPTSATPGQSLTVSFESSPMRVQQLYDRDVNGAASIFRLNSIRCVAVSIVASAIDQPPFELPA